MPWEKRGGGGVILGLLPPRAFPSWGWRRGGGGDMQDHNLPLCWATGEWGGLVEGEGWRGWLGKPGAAPG